MGVAAAASAARNSAVGVGVAERNVLSFPPARWAWAWASQQTRPAATPWAWACDLDRRIRPVLVKIIIWINRHSIKNKLAQLSD